MHRKTLFVSLITQDKRLIADNKRNYLIIESNLIIE